MPRWARFAEPSGFEATGGNRSADFTRPLRLALRPSGRGDRVPFPEGPVRRAFEALRFVPPGRVGQRTTLLPQIQQHDPGHGDEGSRE
jgi:hypothetical protein